MTVRYMRAEQLSAVAVEPLRLTCASSGADSAVAAAAAIDVSSGSEPGLCGIHQVPSCNRCFLGRILCCPQATVDASRSFKKKILHP